MPTDEITFADCLIELIRGDITQIPVDAIVNAANASLSGGGGVDGAIHSAAGPALMQELRQYSGCPTGGVVVTGAGLLPAKFVFNAVGPVYRGGDQDEAKLLGACYRKALLLAEEHQCRSISFPSISTGVYGYPIREAAELSLAALVETLHVVTGITNIKLVQFNATNMQAYQKVLAAFSDELSSAQTS